MNNKIQKTAGGVVFYKDYILLIKKNNKWDLPKGKIEKNESKKGTAIQEIFEETGIPKNKLYLSLKLTPTRYLKKINNQFIIKHTTWYAVKFLGNLTDSLIPDINEGITKCKWVSINKLEPKLKKTFPHIVYLIHYYLSLKDKNIFN